MQSLQQRDESAIMKSISIKDMQDTFAMMGNRVHLVMPEGVTTIECQDELHAFITISSQMFYDHEDGFDEINMEKSRRARELFDQLEALYK